MIKSYYRFGNVSMGTQCPDTLTSGGDGKKKCDKNNKPNRDVQTTGNARRCDNVRRADTSQSHNRSPRLSALDQYGDVMMLLNDPLFEGAMWSVVTKLKTALISLIGTVRSLLKVNFSKCGKRVQKLSCGNRSVKLVVESMRTEVAAISSIVFQNVPPCVHPVKAVTRYDVESICNYQRQMTAEHVAVTYMESFMVLRNEIKKRFCNKELHIA